MFKKILICFICFNITALPAFATIKDDFAEKTLSKEMHIKSLQYQNIQDDFVEQTINKTLKPKTLKTVIIEDTFAQKNTNKNQYSKPNVQFDEQLITTSTKTTTPRKILLITEDENSTPIKIRIKKYLSSKHKVDEGDYVEFETVADTIINKKNYPAGTIIKGRIETLSLNKIWGVPSDLTVGNFSIDGKPLNGEISKTGANRSLWLYPTVYMTTFFFGVGLLLIPIRGGHAKIKPQQIYTVYYQQ